jgi:hypothetical protein
VYVVFSLELSGSRKSSVINHNFSGWKIKKNIWTGHFQPLSQKELSECTVENGFRDFIDGLSRCAGPALSENAENDVSAGGPADAGKGADVGDVAGFGVNVTAVRRLLEVFFDRAIVARFGKCCGIPVGERGLCHIAEDGDENFAGEAVFAAETAAVVECELCVFDAEGVEVAFDEDETVLPFAIDAALCVFGGDGFDEALGR